MQIQHSLDEFDYPVVAGIVVGVGKVDGADRKWFYVLSVVGIISTTKLATYLFY